MDCFKIKNNIARRKFLERHLDVLNSLPAGKSRNIKCTLEDLMTQRTIG